MAELQRDALMKRIQQVCFAAHECALYLDSHPYDRKALSLHRRFANDARDLTAQYESRFGPIRSESAADSTEKQGWTWATDPWPWQKTED